jgi:hypothetical protein
MNSMLNFNIILSEIYCMIRKHLTTPFCVKTMKNVKLQTDLLKIFAKVYYNKREIATEHPTLMN